jgi:hypothetical protein
MRAAPGNEEARIISKMMAREGGDIRCGSWAETNAHDSGRARAVDAMLGCRLWSA